MASASCGFATLLGLGCCGAVVARVLSRRASKRTARYQIVGEVDDCEQDELIDEPSEDVESPDQLPPSTASSHAMPPGSAAAAAAAAEPADTSQQQWVAEMDRELAAFDQLVDTSDSTSTPGRQVHMSPGQPGWNPNLEHELANALATPGHTPACPTPACDSARGTGRSHCASGWVASP